MSLEAVRKYFSDYKMDHRIIVSDTSTATVEKAANAHGVDPDQIGKTLSFKLDDKPILIVVSGTSKINNQKYKSQFFKKAKRLNQNEVLEHTGYAIGGCLS
ncbi:MAG: YbaK/EbsC family protein, partial [Proteobacteria bacterium]|nr:YbaK/EbsC family protein [Pseudomonadota bacterium]